MKFKYYSEDSGRRKLPHFLWYATQLDTVIAVQIEKIHGAKRCLLLNVLGTKHSIIVMVIISSHLKWTTMRGRNNASLYHPYHLAWALNTTYIPMARGFMYLTAVLDWATRKIMAAKRR